MQNAVEYSPERTSVVLRWALHQTAACLRDQHVAIHTGATVLGGVGARAHVTGRVTELTHARVHVQESSVRAHLHTRPVSRDRGFFFFIDFF